MEIDSFLLVSANKNKVLGIAPSLSQSSAVVVTIEYQGVYVYDVPTQQCLTSWLLSPGMKLTSHATLHSASGTFLAVQDHKTLLSWNVGMKDFNQVSRHVYPEGNIFSIHVSAKLSTHFVLVFSSGTVGFYDLDRNLVKQWYVAVHKVLISRVPTREEGKSNNTKDKGGAVDDAHSEHILACVLKEGQKTRLRFLLIDQLLNITELKSTDLQENDSLVTASFDPNSFTFASFWSSHQFLLHRFSPSFSSPGGFSRMETSVIRRKLHNFHENKGIVSVFLRTGQLVLAGKTKSQLGSSNLQSLRVQNSTNPSPSPLPSPSLATQPKKKRVEGSTKRKSDQGPAGIEDGSTFSEAQGGGGGGGDPGSFSNVVLLWDTKLGVLQGSHTIESVPTPNPVPDLPGSHNRQNKNTTLVQALVNLDATNIIFALEGSVVVCPIIFCPDPTLKEALGKSIGDTALPKEESIYPNYVTIQDILAHQQPSTHNNTADDGHQGNRGKGKNNRNSGSKKDAGSPIFLETSPFLGSRGNKSKEVLAKLLSKTATPNQTSFNKVLRSYVAAEELSESGMSNTHSHGQQTQIIERKVYFSQSVAVELGKRCLSEQMWSSLEILLQVSPLSSQALPSLLPTLMQHEQISVLLEAIALFEDISSSTQVEVMKYFISDCNKKQLRDKLATTAARDLVEQNDPLSLVLNLLISRPVNRQFMLRCLKALDVKEIKVLLTYLSESLNYFAYHTMISVHSKETKNNSKFNYPSLKQILLWSSMLIDAHYSRFIIVDEMAELIKELNVLVEAHLELCKELAKLKGPVQHVISGGALPQAEGRDYEILHLSF